MNKYLEDLKKELEKENISNIDEIIDKYEARYNFGLEAGLSDDEIIEMLGDIDDIVDKYKEEKETIKEDNDNNIEKPILYIKTVRDDVIIKESNDDSCHLYFENTKSSYYDVKNSKSKGIVIDYIKSMVLTLNKIHGTITIEIPKNKYFKTCEFNLGSSDFKTIDLNADKISLITTSGDLEISNLISKGDLSIHCVKSDIEIKKVECDGELHITNASGDIDIDYAKGKYIKIDTLSGDVNLKEAEGEINTKSITGDIHVNGKDFSNLRKNIGRMFR